MAGPPPRAPVPLLHCPSPDKVLQKPSLCLLRPSRVPPPALSRTRAHFGRRKGAERRRGVGNDDAAREPPAGAPGPCSGPGCAGTGTAGGGSRSGSGSRTDAGAGAGERERGPQRAARGADEGLPGGAGDARRPGAPPRAGRPRGRRARRHGVRRRLRLHHLLPLPRTSSSFAVPVEPRRCCRGRLRASRRASVPNCPNRRRVRRRGLDHRSADLQCRIGIGRDHNSHQQ